MSSLRSRQSILVLGAVAVAAGSLLFAGSAQAAQALFRVDQFWHSFPDPAQTKYGAGLYQAYIKPYTAYSNPVVATVQSGNPIGGAFTLPSGFLSYTGTFSITPQTGWPGYTTITYSDYYNGPGKFQPNNGATATTRIYFKTTGNNDYPVFNPEAKYPPPPDHTRTGLWTGGMLGVGNPATPTTTFDGRYDKSRAGSILVTPGKNRFGGTMRQFYGPKAGYFQYIYYFSPNIFTVEADWVCRDQGNVTCTPDTFVSTAGDVTQIYVFYRFLLTKYRNTRQLTSTTENGLWPTPNGDYSWLVGVARYLNTIHPWTTGRARVHQPLGSPRILTPTYNGYDINAGYTTIMVSASNKYQNFNTTNQTINTGTNTFQQTLTNVGRIVSLVRPRLIQTYSVPIRGSGDAIENTWPVARMWRMRVYFLPEPAGMLLLGVGMAAVLGLSRMRRR
jgi:hypothetical protein